MQTFGQSAPKAVAEPRHASAHMPTRTIDVRFARDRGVRYGCAGEPEIPAGMAFVPRAAPLVHILHLAPASASMTEVFHWRDSPDTKLSELQSSWPMKTFIRVAEVWVPDSDGYLLELGGALYANAPEFGAISRSMCFGRGEGLPGRVWEEGAPIVLKDLQGGYFQRAAAAKAAELTCAVAFPVFYGDLLKAVVVLFCGDVDGQSGGIEVWRNDPRATTDLKLLDGVYGANDVAFEVASREASLPRGAGLPGLAWQQQASVLMDGLPESTKSVRSEAASTTRIRQGLAIPCTVPSNENFVLTFLSEPSMPIAIRIESWVPDADGQSLKQAYGFGSPGAATAAGEVDQTTLEAFASGVPKVRDKRSGQGSGALIALPIISDGAVVEAVAMYL
jgi:hypothetical protein